MIRERFKCEASSYDEYHNPSSYNVWDTVKRMVDYNNSLLERSQSCVDLRIYEDMCDKLNKVYTRDRDVLLKTQHHVCDICEYENICQDLRKCDFEIRIDRGVRYVEKAKELLNKEYYHVVDEKKSELEDRDMTKERFEIYNEKTKQIFIDKETCETYSSIDAEKIVELLNKQDKKIQELERWRDTAITGQSENSILWNELGIAREQGYKLSDAFEKYLNKLKEDLNE